MDIFTAYKPDWTAHHFFFLGAGVGAWRIQCLQNETWIDPSYRKCVVAVKNLIKEEARVTQWRYCRVFLALGFLPFISSWTNTLVFARDLQHGFHMLKQISRRWRECNGCNPLSPKFNSRQSRWKWDIVIGDEIWEYINSTSRLSDSRQYGCFLETLPLDPGTLESKWWLSLIYSFIYI